MLKLIYLSFLDLYRLHFPKSREEYAFAFIVHPRDNKDIFKKFPFLKLLPERLLKFYLKEMWPTTVSTITGLRSNKSDSELTGWLISIPLTAKMMLEDRELAVEKIVEAVKLARNKGAKIVAFGALTSSVTNGGLLVKEKIDGINFTTGHAYTGLNVFENVDSVVKMFELEKDKVSIAVVGASGSIGTITTQLLIEEGYKNITLIDIPRKIERLEKVFAKMDLEYPHLSLRISTNIKDVYGKDVIVTATNAEEAVIRSENVSPGTIIVDDAQPSDVHDDVLLREDVLVLEAGVVHTPNISTNFNLGLKHRNDNFCCMAELLVLASHEWQNDYVLYRADLDSVTNIKKMRSTLDFRLGDYQNRKKKISEEDKNNFRKVIQNKKG